MAEVNTRIVVLGGGIGGFDSRASPGAGGTRADVEITLVSRENFFVLTPLLFEACSGRLELRHCAQPIRSALRRARFIEATVEAVDVEASARPQPSTPAAARTDLPYDHLVVSLGASTNETLIPGSTNALTFKTMADALVLRNQLIEQFELADAASDSTTRSGCLTVVVIGGGLVGVELLGELTAFADDVLRYYPRIRRDEMRFQLFEAGARILPEIDEQLAAAARACFSGVAPCIRDVDARPLDRVPARASRGRDHRGRHNRSRGGHRSERRRQRDSRRSTTTAAGSSSMRRCGAEATRTSGRSAIAPRSQDRTAGHIPHWRSTPSARRGSSRAM